MDRRSLLYALGGSALTSFVPWAGASAANQNLLGYIRTNWSRDPYSFGSYSYIAKGAKRRDTRNLEKPINGKVFFAGEAVFPKYNSTVHAAYESGQRVADSVLKENVANVAIIGAGMSGISAANKLALNGLNINVFEARDRIGGRIWTDLSLDIPLDLGASWIHGAEDNPLTTLADRAGQERIETQDSQLIIGRGGRRINDMPLWLYNVASFQHGAGADYSQINKLAYLFQDDYDGPEVIFPGGYSKIFDALTGNFDVRLSTSVDHITITDRGVVIGFSDIVDETFDAVIVTVPLGVLKNKMIKFDPPLPQNKRKAIARLGMGTLDKVYLLFDNAFWDLSATWILTPDNDLPRGQFNQWLNLHRYIGKPVIMAFNGGTPALDLADLPDDELITKALQTLKIAFPGD